MTAIDRELRIIDSLLRDLQTRWAGAQKPAAASPIKFGLQLFGTRYEIGKIDAKQIVPFDHIRITFLNQRGESLNRRVLGFFDVLWIDNDQLVPAGVVGNGNAHDVISRGIGILPMILGTSAGSRCHRLE